MILIDEMSNAKPGIADETVNKTVKHRIEMTSDDQIIHAKTFKLNQLIYALVAL